MSATAAPELRCSLCHRIVRKVWRTDDERAVCGDCIAGYRLCAHGYTNVCYACGRGFDDQGRKVLA